MTRFELRRLGSSPETFAEKSANIEIRGEIDNEATELLGLFAGRDESQFELVDEKGTHYGASYLRQVAQYDLNRRAQIFGTTEKSKIQHAVEQIYAAGKNPSGLDGTQLAELAYYAQTSGNIDNLILNLPDKNPDKMTPELVEALKVNLDSGAPWMQPQIVDALVKTATRDTVPLGVQAAAREVVRGFSGSNITFACKALQEVIATLGSSSASCQKAFQIYVELFPGDPDLFSRYGSFYASPHGAFVIKIMDSPALREGYVQKMKEYVRSPEGWVRAAALVGSRNFLSQGELLKALKTDLDPQVRRVAAQELESILDSYTAISTERQPLENQLLDALENDTDVEIKKQLVCAFAWSWICAEPDAADARYRRIENAMLQAFSQNPEFLLAVAERYSKSLLEHAHTQKHFLDAIEGLLDTAPDNGVFRRALRSLEMTPYMPIRSIMFPHSFNEAENPYETDKRESILKSQETQADILSSQLKKAIQLPGAEERTSEVLDQLFMAFTREGFMSKQAQSVAVGAILESFPKLSSLQKERYLPNLIAIESHHFSDAERQKITAAIATVAADEREDFNLREKAIEGLETRATGPSASPSDAEASINALQQLIGNPKITPQLREKALEGFEKALKTRQWTITPERVSALEKHFNSPGTSPGERVRCLKILIMIVESFELAGWTTDVPKEKEVLGAAKAVLQRIRISSK